jgi:hypothetical protein
LIRLFKNHFSSFKQSYQIAYQGDFEICHAKSEPFDHSIFTRYSQITVPKLPLTCEVDLLILPAHAKGDRIIKDNITEEGVQWAKQNRHCSA